VAQRGVEPGSIRCEFTHSPLIHLMIFLLSLAGVVVANKAHGEWLSGFIDLVFINLVQMQGILCTARSRDTATPPTLRSLLRK
jgi:hypothetical protein